MKKRILFFSVLITLTICSQSFAYSGKDNKSNKHNKGIKEIFFGKMKMIWINQDDLKITTEQMDKIKKLKIDTKKELIRKHADIDIIKLDIKAELWKESLDEKNINKLIDKKYEAKKEKSKLLVKAYLSLKEILTDEQKTKMKALKKKCFSIKNKKQCKSMKQCQSKCKKQ